MDEWSRGGDGRAVAHVLGFALFAVQPFHARLQKLYELLAGCHKVFLVFAVGWVQQLAKKQRLYRSARQQIKSADKQGPLRPSDLGAASCCGHQKPGEYEKLNGIPVL